MLLSELTTPSPSVPMFNMSCFQIDQYLAEFMDNRDGKVTCNSGIKQFSALKT